MRLPTRALPAQNTKTMEAEHLNQIGTRIEDLSARTAELRGYL